MKKALAIACFIISILSLKAFCAAEINVGDYIRLGSYNSRPIVWRVIGAGENGTDSLLLISDKILTLKAFDAKTDGAVDSMTNYSEMKGSNRWSTSSLREWLNSSESSVAWAHGNLPDTNNVKHGIGAYDKERGFLNDGNFTEAERSVLLPYTYDVPISYKHVDGWPATVNAVNLENFWIHFYSEELSDIVKNYSGQSSYSTVVLGNKEDFPIERGAYETLTDLVFLPSVVDVYNMKNPPALLGSYPFGIEYYMARPDEAAIAKNSGYFDIKPDGNWPYWLRDPVAQSTDDSLVRAVGTNGRVWYDSAYNGAVGVRPACYLDNSARVAIESGSGTEKSPYVITTRQAVRLSARSGLAYTGTDVQIQVQISNAEPGDIVRVYHNGKLAHDNVTDGSVTVTAKVGNNRVEAKIYNGGSVIGGSNVIAFRGAGYVLEDVFLERDFDDGESAGYGFSSVQNGANSLSPTVEYTDAVHGNSLLLRSRGGTSAAVYTTPFSPSAECVYIEANVKFNSLSFSLTRTFFEAKLMPSENWVQLIQITRNGAFSLNGVLGEVKPLTITQGQWYNFKLIFNNASKTLTFVVDNEFICYNAKLGYDFDYVSYGLFTATYNSGNNTNSMHIDNVVLANAKAVDSALELRGVEYDGESNTVSGSVVSNTADGKGAALFGAVLDGTMLENIYISEVEFEEDGAQVVPFSFPIENKHRGLVLNLLLWDRGLNPFTPSLEVPLQ